VCESKLLAPTMILFSAYFGDYHYVQNVMLVEMQCGLFNLVKEYVYSEFYQ